MTLILIILLGCGESELVDEISCAGIQGESELMSIDFVDECYKTTWRK